MIPALSLTFLCVIAGYTDLKKFIIPDWVTLPGIVTGLACPLLFHNIPLQASLTGGLTGLLFFGLTAYLSRLALKKEALGGGDIKLAAMLGTFLGWNGLLAVIFASSLLGLVISVILILLKKINRNSPIPFGFYLSLAAIVFTWISKL
ncbi:MAG: A24 family peptidase [bacterium]|nr:A24 family peptidase [bacterium]